VNNRKQSEKAYSGCFLFSFMKFLFITENQIFLYSNHNKKGWTQFLVKTEHLQGKQGSPKALFWPLKPSKPFLSSQFFIKIYADSAFLIAKNPSIESSKNDKFNFIISHLFKKSSLFTLWKLQNHLFTTLEMTKIQTRNSLFFPVSRGNVKRSFYFRIVKFKVFRWWRIK